MPQTPWLGSKVPPSLDELLIQQQLAKMQRGLKPGGMPAPIAPPLGVDAAMDILNGNNASSSVKAPGPSAGMPTSMSMSRNPQEALAGLDPVRSGSPRPPLEVNDNNFGAPAGLASPAPSSGAPSGPPMSTPGSPLMGPDPSQGLQGPEALPPSPDGPGAMDALPPSNGEPLTSTQDVRPMDAPVGGQSPMMALNVAGQDPSQGGGDLVNLIKRLLHKNKPQVSSLSDVGDMSGLNIPSV